MLTIATSLRSCFSVLCNMSSISPTQKGHSVAMHISWLGSSSRNRTLVPPCLEIGNWLCSLFAQSLSCSLFFITGNCLDKKMCKHSTCAKSFCNIIISSVPVLGGWQLHFGGIVFEICTNDVWGDLVLVYTALPFLFQVPVLLRCPFLVTWNWRIDPLLQNCCCYYVTV